MQNSAGQTLYEVELVLVSLLLVGGALAFVVARLRRSRPGFSPGSAVVVGVAVRLLAIVVASAVAPSLRGTDEMTFLEEARKLVELPFGAWLDSFASSFGRQPGPNAGSHPGTLQTWLFALELEIDDLPSFSMHAIQVGFAVAGIVLLGAAVYDLAGARAAKLATWIVVLEPSNVFFSGFLHKESLLLFAVGLVALGGVKVWTRRELPGLVFMGIGLVIAIGTRPYAGWLLVAATAVTCGHAAITRRGPVQRRSLRLLAVVAVLGAAAAPAALQQTSDEQIQERLGASQELNSTMQGDLNFESVDYSDRASVITNLPLRMKDVLLRPYPWELADPDQRPGLPGTLAALAILAFLAWGVAVNRGRVFAHAAPLIYPGLFLLVAFSLSSANAGSSFRLRTHLVALGVAVAIALWHQRRSAPVASGPKRVDSAASLAVDGRRPRPSGAPALPARAGSST